MILRKQTQRRFLNIGLMGCKWPLCYELKPFVLQPRVTEGSRRCFSGSQRVQISPLSSCLPSSSAGIGLALLSRRFAEQPPLESLPTQLLKSRWSLLETGSALNCFNNYVLRTPELQRMFCCWNDICRFSPAKLYWLINVVMVLVLLNEWNL